MKKFSRVSGIIFKALPFVEKIIEAVIMWRKRRKRL